MNSRFARVIFLSALAVAMAGCVTTPTDLDPKAVTYTPLDKIQWKDNPAGTAANAMIYGN